MHSGLKFKRLKYSEFEKEYLDFMNKYKEKYMNLTKTERINKFKEKLLREGKFITKRDFFTYIIKKTKETAA